VILKEKRLTIEGGDDFLLGTMTTRAVAKDWCFGLFGKSVVQIIAQSTQRAEMFQLGEMKLRNTCHDLEEKFGKGFVKMREGGLVKIEWFEVRLGSEVNLLKQ
jgi:hypothetical protein